MNNYYGKITIDSIENDIEVSNITGELKDIHKENLKFVHYPDCQQLIIWLPNNYKHYNSIKVIDASTQDEIFKKEVQSIISGSIQIIIDTLFVYPGKFSIIIDTIKGGTHTIEITKFLENKVKTIDEAPKYESPKHTSEAIEYVDGFGKLVPNEDLILREKAIKKIYEKLSRRLEYVSYGRDGKVIYIEGDKSIQFYMEMGGYNCVFYLNIPSKINWEKETNFSIEERDEILSFVAEGTKREHATSCRYEINDYDIAYYRN